VSVNRGTCTLTNPKVKEENRDLDRSDGQVVYDLNRQRRSNLVLHLRKRQNFAAEAHAVVAHDEDDDEVGECQ
jgi:hypothetical protein